jgi:hypothetical protein
MIRYLIDGRLVTRDPFLNMSGGHEKVKESNGGSAGSAALLSVPLPSKECDTIDKALKLQKAITVHSPPSQISEWVLAFGPQFKVYSNWILNESIGGIELMTCISK